MTLDELLALIDRLAAEGATELDLSGQGLTELPPEIGKLTQLETLILGKVEEWEWVNNKPVPMLITNQLTTLPAELKNLTRLQTLNLSGNPLTVIPEAVFQLHSLVSLRLASVGLLEIPEALRQLSNLTKLYLHSNQITQIPEVLGQLGTLTVLYLGGNRITQIPEVLGQLSNLTELSLWGNQITQIPEVLGQLSNLIELYLWGNQITQIPEVLGQLSNLTELNLRKNKITAFPECLESLPKLTKLGLRGNLLPISPELLKSLEAESIFDYCRQARSGTVKPLNEAKLLLVGQGSVGKTSLISRLINDRYNPNEPQTDGLNVTPWQIHINSKDVKLNVWDFGGQEIYHATHQFFLTKRSLYLLVVSCRDSEEQNQLDYWLKLIESFGDQSPVIIVGNKCDEQPLDLNRRALREKYPNIKAIIETSCQTNHGIAELRSAIYQEISDLREVYDLLPLSWFEVKQQLEQLNEECISYSKYVGICITQGISEEVHQERLIELLHNLGLVLNFRDHPILQNTSVLKPNWVTEGIYSLLSDDDLKTVNKGILTASDLSRILNPERYPANRHHFLTELIKEFQLGFPIVGEASLQENRPTPTLLIPGLLPKEEPETDLEGDTLGFQYHYAILPDSVISRFIVLIHQKIHNQIYWRTGVMLAYREGNDISNLARIKSDPTDSKIFISIDGRQSTRRSFLALIRDVFNRIHNSFANLEVIECVPVPGHPDHPPLDYQELLGLEAMGERDYPIGKLRIKVNLRQLLDGYESIESRQVRRMGDWDEERLEQHYHHYYGDVFKGDKVGNDKMGGDKVGRDKIQNQ